MKRTIIMVASAVSMGTLFVMAGCQKKAQPPESGSGQPAAVTAQVKNEPVTTGPGTVASDEPLPDLKIQVTKKQAKYFPEGSPTRAIQDLDDMLDSYIVDPQTPEQKQYNKDLKRVVLHGTFDVRELCMLSLADHWKIRTTEEQDYFVNLMKKLLERKAIFSKEQGVKKSKKKTKELYKVTYEGDSFLNSDKTQALTRSSLFVPSENLRIGLHYKLKKVDAGWKIFDIIVDGASLLDNYKYQFDKIIQKEGYPGLISRMETKLKEIQSGSTADED